MAQNEPNVASMEEHARTLSHRSRGAAPFLEAGPTPPHARRRCCGFLRCGGGGKVGRGGRLRPLVLFFMLVALSFLIIAWINKESVIAALSDDGLAGGGERLTRSPRDDPSQTAGGSKTAPLRLGALSVAVAHHSPLRVLDEVQRRLVAADQAATTAMLRTQLPSWTLRHVEAECAECLDSETHAAAVQRQGGADGAAVFATAAAPLGIAGPMLLAMASVTDDVDGAAELARWSWVPRSYAMRRQFSGASPAGLRGGTSPYLVVLGIPSTDQPVRAALRDAQRATWLSYREVARSGNDFCGALLPLYLFAAAERELTSGVTDVSPLLPTVAEYEAASVARLHADNESGEVRDYGVRRVLTSLGAFRDTVLSAEQLLESPCTSVVARTVNGDTARKSTWLVKLTSGLELPATPAAVAPAQFICHASAALWQEALAHRNAVWIDMMTDRKPTSKKKLGQGGNWGLPVEVGMTQKTILWLHYAYHAFPDVPYIMKSDDDTYLKVPQFLRDIRYFRSGYDIHFAAAVNGTRDPAGVEKTERCVYWGRVVEKPLLDNLRYHGGNGYLLHRRLVHAMLETADARNREYVALAVVPFNNAYAAEYSRLRINTEDIFIGLALRGRSHRASALCPANTIEYVSESMARMHDTHVRSRSIDYRSLLLHHVTAFDSYYIHYYYQHEHEAAREVARKGGGASAEWTRRAKAWARAAVPPSTQGYNRFTAINWRHPQDIPDSFADAEDNVSVYAISYSQVSQLWARTFYFKANVAE